MKKLLALMLAAALALSLVACGGSGGTGDNSTPSAGNGDTTSTGTPSSGEDSANTDTPDDGEDSTTDIHKVGDTVESELGLYRFTLKDATFTRNILVCRGEKADKETFRKAEEFFTATDEPFVDENGNVIEGIHGFGIGADKDDIYLYFNLEVEFIGTEERTVGRQDFQPSVSYGDYKFTSDYMSFYRELENDDLWSNFDADSLSNVKALGLEIGYFNGAFKPLSSPPIEIRGVIRVPKAVAEHTDGDVVISFAGKDFVVE